MKEPVNTWTHFITFLASILGTILLIISSYGDTTKLVTMTIYGVSLIVLYGASSLYHWVETTPKREKILRKIDHISIFILIAGTYTPVFYYGLEGLWRWVMLSIIWGLSLIGMIIKLFFIGVNRAVSTIFYVMLGWAALIPMFQLVRNLPAGAIVFMLAGGILYTIGAVIYGKKIFNFLPNKFGFHEIFHIFISLGSLMHFIMIWGYILPM